MPYYRQNPNYPMQSTNQPTMPMATQPMAVQPMEAMKPMQNMKPGQGMQPTGTMSMTSPLSMSPALPAQTPMTPAFPSGMPTGPSYSAPVGPADDTDTSDIQPAPQTLQSPMYTPGYLRTQLGRRMRVEFLIGTNMLTDRTGTLVGVGASYILLQLVDSDDIMLCDLYSIKFATILL